MNPLLLLMLGLGGFMTAFGSPANTATTSSGARAPEPDSGADEPAEPAQPAEPVDLVMVIWDMAERDVVEVVTPGESLDFGTADTSTYTFAAETNDGRTVGSMELEYQGQTWLQNFYPYTLEDSPLDLAEGDFEVTVTAYSGPDATGEVLGTRTIAFSTASEAPVVDETSQEAQAPEEEEPVVEEPAVEEPVVEEPVVEEPAAPGEQDGSGGAAAGVGLTMVIWDMNTKSIVEEVSDGEAIDFGAALVDGYTFAAETADGSAIGSMELEYQGQTWLQNFYPYTLEDSPLDLAEGDFEVTVTAYSGPDATGEVLGTRTIAFSTTSQEPEVVVVEEEVQAPVVDEPVAEEPAVEEPVVEDEAPSTEDNAPTVIDPNPTAAEQSGDNGAGGETAPTPIDGTVTVIAGRVATLEPQLDDVSALKIVSGLDHGNVTVNPDGTFAVVLTLSDSTANQSFRYEATHSNGSTSTHTVNLNVVEGPQEDGWATGATHYTLETDENDDVVVETGDDHTKVYVSGSGSALSLADIAQMEGMSTSQVTGAWLANSKYGQSEEFALDETAGQALWGAVAGNSKTSSWLLLDRGHEYDTIRFGVGEGESELHPLYLGAYGDGHKPVITDEFTLMDGDRNIVIQDIQFDGGMRINGAENVIFDSITVREDEMVIWKSESITVRNSDFVDIYFDESKDGGDFSDHADRIQGLFANLTDGLLLEGLYLDHNGWAPDYASGDGQPPSIFSHNLYLGRDITDLTLRDTISSRGASFGAQVRSGGFIEDNVLLDNNYGLNTLGGNYNDAGHIGSYSLVADNVITSGAHKEPSNGALATGYKDLGLLTTSIDNIVAHLADPDNPEELADKEKTGDGFVAKDPYYNDTIVYNWHGADPEIAARRVSELNTDGLDTAALDETTIQNFAAQLLGDANATIDDLADYLTSQYENELDVVVDADLIVRYFQEGFGIADDIRTSAETLRFVPDDLGEGVRWDNRLNWTTEDLPGTVVGDSVDLGGNTVIYNGLTSKIDELELGPDGRLELYGGKLTASGGLSSGDGGGEVRLDDTGQLWTEGHGGTGLDVDIVGGRFVNTGVMTDTTLTATGGETVLATGGAIYGVSAGETLSIDGRTEAGFDDDDGGVALLAFDESSTLHLDVADGKLGAIEEFRTGAFGDASDVRSGIDLGNAALKIDLVGLSASEGADLMLLEADEIIGAFDSADIAGLGSRDATVVIDYMTDSVSLQLSSGSGRVAFRTVGEASDVGADEQALWDALTAGQGVFDESTPDPEIPEDETEYLAAG